MWNIKDFSATYARFCASGLKVRDFCANECINESRFYYWQKKLKSSESPQATPSGFVPLVISPHYPFQSVTVNEPVDQLASVPLYEIIYPNGVKLHLPTNSDLRLLKSLIFLSE